MVDKMPDGKGKSSFELIDEGEFFSMLNLQSHFVFLDLACGRGLYSIAAADYIGEKGRIYAVDQWEEGIASLKMTIEQRGISQILPLQGDMARRIPLENRSVDVCLIAGVLHHLLHENTHATALKEIGRVLRQQGVLAIVEFKKIAGPPGPPRQFRIPSEELGSVVLPFGFYPKVTREIGPYHYLSLFSYAATE